MSKEYEWMKWHGKLGKKDWPIPKCVAKTKKVNRKDQGNLTNASEYLDDLKVLDEKMKIVAELIKKAKCLVTYTGAGISRASGIPDYGTKAENSVMKKVKVLRSPINAEPTYSHHVLANLEKLGFLKYYVQQNHDGLPQKAGFPQEKMNEIHGAWFDPSNPVVKFSGTLRSDLFKAMAEIEERIDLCLCCGTSLSGMNADRCVTTPCEKFAGGVEDCLGSIIINLQFTPVDIVGYVPVRVWSKIDDAMKLLVKHLGIKIEIRKIKVEKDVILIPYNKKGEFDQSKKMKFDMSKGKEVIITHPDTCNKGKTATILGKDVFGHYKIRFKNGNVRMFGSWWMNCIKNGNVLNLPLMNVKPQFVKPKKEVVKKIV